MPAKDGYCAPMLFPTTPDASTSHAAVPVCKDDGDIRSFFDNATEGMFRKSRTGKFILVNPALAKIFGYASPGELLKHFPKDQENVTLDAARFLDLLTELKSKGEIKNFEMQFRRKDGLLIWVLVNARTVYTVKGSIKYYEGTLVDITQRKDAEAEHSIIEEQIHQSQRMEAISIVAGGIASDFSTLIRPIVSSTESALKHSAGNEQVQGSLTTILGAANSAMALINQFLAISRRGKGEMRSIQLLPIITEAISDVKADLPDTVILQEEISTMNGTVLADSEQIRRVLDNLLNNALQSLDNGGTITVRTACVEFDERTGAFRADLIPGRYVRVTVHDNGIGIPEPLLPRIFDPFFTTRSSQGAQGLGLAVAHGIARAHDGGITVLSEEGLGSTFCLYLPFHEQEVDHSRPIAPSPRLGSERILLVTPEEQEIRKWRGLLVPLGYRIETVSGSVEALRLFLESPDSFDLVVATYSMPQMNGLEFARTLLGVHPSTRLIMYADPADPITEELARRAGIYQLSHKPLTTNSIFQLMQSALEDRQE
ncbi:MAG: ATP-binding protein [Desulfovibrionales bacterium]|nr:ATP-binding protein [Desulfovibrionales bacterium]